MEAGIHRLRATIHLTKIIDDTLTYLRPKCSLSDVPGSTSMSSQLFGFLNSKQYSKKKPARVSTTIQNIQQVGFSKCLR